MGSIIEVDKFWQKKWKPIKDSLFLTSEQHSVLIGSILGDGTLRVGTGAINANLKIEHGLVQKDYVVWKYKIFRPWVFTEPKISYRYRESGEKYAKSWWFRTVRHPILTKFRNRFYENGKKVIPGDIVKDIDNLAMAIWVMDDGSLNKNHIDISTYAFSLSEVRLLIAALNSRFGLSAKYYRDRDKGHRMYFNLEDTKNLIEIIKPYVMPVMQYKVKLR